MDLVCRFFLLKYLLQGAAKSALLFLEAARFREAALLSQVNANPDMSKVSKLLGEVVASYQEALDSGVEAAKFLALVGLALCNEEAVELNRIFAGDSGGGQEAGKDQAATDDANMDEVIRIRCACTLHTNLIPCDVDNNRLTWFLCYVGQCHPEE